MCIQRTSTVTLVALVWVAMVEVVAADGQYGVIMESRVTGRLESNSSGHWTATVRVEQPSLSTKERMLLLDATPSITRYRGVRTVALTVTVQGQPLPPSSDYGKITWSGSYYKIHEEQVSWEEAKIICEEENAHLLVLNSNEEAQNLKTFAEARPNLTDYLHVGFYDKNKQGNFITIFGETFAEAGYAEWSANEPSGNEYCGSVMKTSMEFNDIGCGGNKKSFICEQPS